MFAMYVPDMGSVGYALVSSTRVFHGLSAGKTGQPPIVGTSLAPPELLPELDPLLLPELDPELEEVEDPELDEPELEPDPDPDEPELEELEPEPEEPEPDEPEPEEPDDDPDPDVDPELDPPFPLLLPLASARAPASVPAPAPELAPAPVPVPSPPPSPPPAHATARLEPTHTDRTARTRIGRASGPVPLRTADHPETATAARRSGANPAGIARAEGSLARSPTAAP
jgi:hypothetical protein